MIQWLYDGLLGSKVLKAALETNLDHSDCLPPVSSVGYKLVTRQPLLCFHLDLIYDRTMRLCMTISFFCTMY